MIFGAVVFDKRPSRSISVNGSTVVVVGRSSSTAAAAAAATGCSCAYTTFLT